MRTVVIMHFEWIEFSATRTMLVAVWCLLELYFWYHANSTKRRLQQQRKPARLLSRAERQTLYWNCFHTVHEPRKWFAGWFYMIDSPCRESPDFSEIYRENIATWFAWAFWVDHLEMVRSNARWAAELEWMISNAEHRYGVRFPRGHNPKIRCIRPSLDPVESIHRPLLFYAFNYCLTWLFNVVFLRWFWHFEYHGTSTPSAAWGGIFATLHRWERALWPCSNGIDTASSYQHLTFWYRKQGQKKTPIVFVHGIGMGLLFYADLIHRLVKLDRPVFLIEIPYVSMRLVEHVPTPEETASEIDNMLTSQGYNQAIFVAHSFGTAVASWLATFAPKLMGGLVMVDPICFLLNYHHVAFNMLHRVPKKAMEYFIHYFASRELFINHYISRHFQWYRTIFIVYPTPSEEPPKLPTNQVEPSSPLSNATVFLSEKDIIVDSTVINDYLKERGVDVRLMRNLRHGGFLIDRKWRQQVLDQTEQLARNIEGEGIVNKA